jgi:hypothetical protein
MPDDEYLFHFFSAPNPSIVSLKGSTGVNSKPDDLDAKKVTDSARYAGFFADADGHPWEASGNEKLLQ